MGRRAVSLIAVLAIVLFTAFGCTDGAVNTDGDDTMSELKIVPNEAAKASGISQAQLNLGVVSEGNVSNIAKVMRRANAGEDITFAVLGGSITAGSTSSTQDRCYASLTYAWWQKAFPKADITFHNMGIGATTSTLGVHRLEKDILSKNPDFIIVEFAVNDAETDADLEAYEDIIRRLWKHNPDMGIVSLYMTTERKWNCQKGQHDLLDKYCIPQISYHNVLWDMIDNEKKYVWRDISKDDVHPNDIGHAIASSLITSFLEAVKEKCDAIPDAPAKMPAPVYGERYMNAKLCMGNEIDIQSKGSWEEAEFYYYHLKGAWKTSGEGDPMTVKAKASEVSVVFKKMVSDPDTGKIRVLVDGRETAVVDSEFPGGWGDYMAIEKVFSADDTAEHEISIQCLGGNFTLCGLLIA